jgi:hypothetical protein
LYWHDSPCPDKSEKESLNLVNGLEGAYPISAEIRTEIGLICPVKYEVIRTMIDVQGKAHR